MPAPRCPENLVKQIDNKCKPCGTPTIEGYPTQIDPGDPKKEVCIPICPAGKQIWYHLEFQYWTCVPECDINNGIFLDPLTGECKPKAADQPEEAFPWGPALAGILLLGGTAFYLRGKRTGT